MYKHILVPTDGSLLSRRAVKTAAKLAAKLGAKLTAVHVVAPWMPPLYGDPIGYSPLVVDPREHKARVERSAHRILAEASRIATAQGAKNTEAMATSEHPWEAILKVARARKCDVIVMASHGRRGLAGVLLGSETAKVVTHSRLPVLVCR